MGVVFHQNPLRAESILRSVIKGGPKSREAYEAYEWLSHLYLYSGQYRRLISTMEARWAAFPEKADTEGEKAALAGLRGLPDQVTERVRPSIVHHEDNSVFVPVTVNSRTAAYFIDTGGWVSSVSESEAKRIGLRYAENVGTTVTMTNVAKFRTAVADDLVVGNVRLKNVSFAVFPDNNEPWSQLAPGRRGLLGFQ